MESSTKIIVRFRLANWAASSVKLLSLIYAFYRESPVTYSGRRGSLQLWQFLVSLLQDPANNQQVIAWTGRGLEFKLIEPEEVICLFLFRNVYF